MLKDLNEHYKKCNGNLVLTTRNFGQTISSWENIEIINKKQAEMNNTIFDIKNMIEVIWRLDEAKDQISELEDKEGGNHSIRGEKIFKK